MTDVLSEAGRECTVVASGQRGDVPHNTTTTTTPQVHRTQQRQSMVYYSQRIALLGAVTSAVGQLIAHEEAERAVLVAALAHLLATEPAASGFVPFEPSRVRRNAIETEEHEARWEMVHEASLLFRQTLALHAQMVHDLTASSRQKLAMERVVLERELTLRLLEIVCHWEVQRQELDAREVSERSVQRKISSARQTLAHEQAEGRQVLALSEALAAKALLRSHEQGMEALADTEEGSGGY